MAQVSGFLSRLTKSPLSQDKRSRFIDIAKSVIPEGLGVFEQVLTFRAGEKITVYDRTCDHAAGKMISDRKSDLAVCPLHGWKFDASTGNYANVQRKKTPLRTMDIGDSIQVAIDETFPVIDSSGMEHDVSIRFLNHACLLIECNGVKFATDPWLFGPAFCSGWWLSHPSPADSVAEVNDCDFIYISHNHPDHMHEETLSHVRSDMPILTGNFVTRSAEKMIRELGFTDILAADFGSVYSDAASDLKLAVLKSGDHRDDSGLYFSFGGFSALLAVDSNSLNFFRLPHATLLASSFAGGATSFPVCFDTMSEPDMRRVFTRNRAAMKAAVDSYLQATTPSVLLPYAGFFVEDEQRDAVVARMKRKNGVSDYEDLCLDTNVRLIDPTKASLLKFSGDRLQLFGVHGNQQDCLPADNKAKYYAKAKSEFSGLSIHEITEYFALSGYAEDVLLFISLTDDEFKPEQTFKVDLSLSPAHVEEVNNTVDLRAASDATGYRTEWFRVRSEAFCKVVRYRLPWEDFSTGFQSRFDRYPDVYNSEMWFHFTNVFIGNGRARASRNCGGACTSIGMKLF